jgi:iron complex outermembrane receptor protein
VVVTANRKKQTIETAPLAISVLKGSELTQQGVSTPQDIVNSVPSVQNGVAGFAIRGIASGDNTEKGDPSTAFSVDGVFISRPQLQTFGMYDLERVEVVKGPQGTLYGRNATAGAINVITAKPVLAEEGSIGGEVGNYGTKKLQFMKNTQLSEDSALRVAGSINRRDGFTPTQDGTKALDSRNDGSVRAKFLKNLGADSNILVTVDHSEENDTGVARLPLDRGLSGDVNQYYQNPGQDGFYKLKTTGAAVEANVNTNVGMLTSITGYRTTSVNGNQLFGDLGGNYGIEDWKNNQFSQELRLASNSSGALQWVAGLFYAREQTDTTPNVYLPFISPSTVLNWNLNATSSTSAAFAQATYSLEPNTRLVGGVRYTQDKKEREGTFTGFGSVQPYNAAVSYNKINWKLGAEHDLPNKALLYGSVSTGYKAGGFNDGNPQTVPALYYNPENLTAYEAGIKGRFLDRRLYLSASIYHYDYRDLQLSSIPPTGGILTLNAGRAAVNGIEAEGKWKASEVDTIDFSVSLSNAQYKQYLPQGAGGPSWEGKSLDRSPKASGRIGYSHDFVTNGGKFTAGIATKYSGSYVLSDFNIPTQYTQKSFWRTDLSLAYRPMNEKWNIQMYVKNVENKRQLAINQFGTMTLTDPRTFGVRAQYHFN